VKDTVNDTSFGRSLLNLTLQLTSFIYLSWVIATLLKWHAHIYITPPHFSHVLGLMVIVSAVRISFKVPTAEQVRKVEVITGDYVVRFIAYSIVLFNGWIALKLGEWA
jgi:hypothetical protein